MRHAALGYATTEDLLDPIVRLAREMAAVDLLVLAGQRHHNRAIAAARLALQVVEMNRPDAHTRPAGALAALRRQAHRGDRGPDAQVMIVAEPDHGPQPRTWARCLQFEAACNIAITDPLVTIICAYDTRTTPDPVLDDVLRTHAELITADGPLRNPDYEEPASVLARLGSDRVDPPPPDPPRLEVTRTHTIMELTDIRRHVMQALADVPTLVRTDFVAAVNEVLTNAYLHGRPPIDVVLWRHPEEVECRVTDRGLGHTDPTAGYRPTPATDTTPDRGGSGLWLARQACDDLETWRTATGFTVRLRTATSAERALERAGAIARAETAHARALRIALRHRR